MVLALIAFIGMSALVSPSAISKTIEKCADNRFDKDDAYDLKLSYPLGFTDTDISTLQYADCIESVSPYPDEAYSVSQNNAIDAPNIYPSLYIHVKGAREDITMSDSYRRLINDAREYIEINMEPSLTAAREQSISMDLRREIEKLESSIGESEEKAASLDEELTTLEKDYEKAIADLDSEQESIDKAKDLIQAREKNAQTTIENGKKDLSGVLDEVYSKANVTASDLKKAQGLSNYVSGSEKSMHKSFTSQWAELSGIETQLHEDQAELTEKKEQREEEISKEKASISQDKAEADKKIRSLESQLDESRSRWMIEDRNSLPEYALLAESDNVMLERFAPYGVLIYSLSFLICMIIIISIVTRNRARIISWRRRGLEDRIIISLFVRRSALSAAIGAVTGSIIGCILSPIAYMYSYSDSIGVPFSGLGAEWLLPLGGTLLLTFASALTALLTYHMTMKKRTDSVVT